MVREMSLDWPIPVTVSTDEAFSKPAFSDKLTTAATGRVSVIGLKVKIMGVTVPLCSTYMRPALSITTSFGLNILPGATSDESFSP